jgi:transcriptional/translational regulatory protein YebC/TACO1
MEIVLESGALDMRTEDETYEITTSPDSFIAVKEALEGRGIPPDSADIQLIPENTVKVGEKDAEQVLKLMEQLEEHDDVQHVYANFDIDDKVLATFNS